MNSNNLNQVENNDELEFANFIFEQLKWQQEVRDTWFGHYLSIIGAVSGLATITFAVFSERLDLKKLEIFLGIIFFITGLVGVLFYLLFLSQRVNYKMHYCVLNELQKKLAKSNLKKSYNYYYPEQRTPFKKLKRGSDFFASLIQRALITVCATTGCALVCLGLNRSIIFIIVLSIIVAIVFLICLGLLYNAYERVI